MRRIRKYRKCLKRKRVERRQDETSKRTSHVVDENRHSFRNVSNENHRVDLVCAFSLFVNQREIDVQTIGDRRHADRKTNGRDFLRRNDFLSIYRFAPKNKEKKRRVFLLPLRNDLNLRRQDWRQQRSWNREYAKKSNGWRPVRQTNYRREYRKIPGKKSGSIFLREKLFDRTWICDACKSIVMMWSAPETLNMLATSLAEIGARLWKRERKKQIGFVFFNAKRTLSFRSCRA